MLTAQAFHPTQPLDSAHPRCPRNATPPRADPPAEAEGKNFPFSSRYRPFPAGCPGGRGEGSPRSPSTAKGRLAAYLPGSAERSVLGWDGSEGAELSSDTALSPAGTPPGRGGEAGVTCGHSRPGVPAFPAEKQGASGVGLTKNPHLAPAVRDPGVLDPRGKLLSALPSLVSIYTHLL